MLNLNSITISGRLTQDPEIKEVGSNKKKLAKIGIAHNQEYFGAAAGARREAIFVDIQVWEKPANFVEKYLKKGDLVVVEGGLTQESWRDKNGAFKSRLAIKARSIQKLNLAKKNDENMPEEDIQDIPDVPPQSRYTPDDYPEARAQTAKPNSTYRSPGEEPMYDDGAVPF